jgi:hypothetical protein
MWVMRESNVANAAKESAHDEFPHGLFDFCATGNRGHRLGAYWPASWVESFCSRPVEAARLRFAQHIVHFAEQLVRSVRLAYEAAVIGNFSLSGLHLTGSDDQEDAGPTSVNLSR